MNAKKYFILVFTLFLTMSLSTSYFLGNALEELLVKVDCNEINERPNDFNPKEGTIDEKIKYCNSWNKFTEDNEIVPLLARIMLMLPFFGFLYHINSLIGIKNMLKNEFDDDEQTGHAMPKGWDFK